MLLMFFLDVDNTAISDLQNNLVYLIRILRERDFEISIDSLIF